MKKKTLLSSILAIVLCLSLMTGASFALFTSEASVNVAVTSGKVSVLASVDEKSVKTYSFDVEQASGVFENGGTATLNNDGDLELKNMTPGDKAELTVDVVNESNVAIKYRVSTTMDGVLGNALVGVATINEKEYELKGGKTAWFTVRPGAEIGDITLAIEFPNAADNNLYQGKEAMVTVAIEAVQANGASLYVPACDVVATPETIDEILANIEEGKTIGLSAGYYDEIVATQNGLTFVAAEAATVGAFNANGKDNVTVDGVHFDAAGAKAICNHKGAELAILANVTDTSKANYSNPGDNLTVKNCVFDGDNATPDDYCPIAFYGRRSSGNADNITISGCNFNASAAYFVYGYYVGEGTHTLKNNTFGSADTTAASGSAVYLGSNQGNTTVTGNTFVNSSFTGTIHNGASSTYKVDMVVTNNNFINTLEDDLTAIALRHYTNEGTTVTVADNEANYGEDAFRPEYTDASGYLCYDVPGSKNIVLANPDNIDAVLATAVEGDVIYLAKGYYEQITASVNKLTFVPFEDGVTVGAFNANGKDEITLKNLTFLASGAKQVYVHKDKAYGTRYANIVGTGEANSNNPANKLTVTGCTFTGVYNGTGSYAPLAFYERGRSSGSMADLTVESCKFESNCAYAIYAVYIGGGTHTVKNNVFGGEGINNGGVWLGNNQGSVDMIGNTFYNCSYAGSIHSATYKNAVVTIKDNKFYADNTEDYSAVGLRYYTAYGATVVFQNNVANDGASTFKPSYVDSANYECFDFTPAI